MQVKEQYKTSKNLDNRISIYNYSDSDKTLPEFIKEKMGKYWDVKVLELGCGTGLLWKSIKDNFNNCTITLSDFSQGMIDISRENLGDDFNYTQIDFHNIPFDDNEFDIVISNHNFYHATDLDIVLSEITRVLKPDGILFSTTNSKKHLNQLEKLLKSYGIGNYWPNSEMTEIFGMESGEEKLVSYFYQVESHPYNHNLRITDPDYVIRYLRSIKDDTVNEVILKNSDYIKSQLNREIKSKGYYLVEARAGLFISKGVKGK